VTTAEAIALAGEVVGLSFLQVGGAMAIAPDLHRLLVSKLALISESDFASSIALAQSAPGPNVLYVAVAGYHVAGVAGALGLLAAVLVPASALSYAIARMGAARPRARGMLAFRAGMAPIAIGLLASTSWILVADAPGWRTAAVAAAAGVVTWRTRVHVLWLIGAGAALGALGAL
jgi:chromate transporter